MTNPEFDRICRAANGVATRKGFEFHSGSDAATVCAHYGHEVEFPFPGRPVVIVHGGHYLTVQMAALEGDVCYWSSTERKKHWTLTLTIEVKPVEVERVRVAEYVNEGGVGQPGGFFIHTKRGWSERDSSSLKYFLMFLYGISKSEAEVIIGGLHHDPWLLQCIPFAGDYPGGRIWNRGAPQLACKPMAGEHPSWNAIFDHAGAALDKYIPADLEKIGIDTGGKYLLAWFAWIIRNPAARLPYLFFFGGENCGKSILWEAFSLLVTRGVVKADRALTSDFNGELDGAILCVVEEKEISRAAGVVERIKDAVTGLTVAVRKMRTDQFAVKNYSHWLQTANSRGACLIPPGDTRMMAIQVMPITAEVPKPVLLERLAAEAPAILHTMLTMVLPEPQGRLALPVIETPDKISIQEDHISPLALKIVDLMVDRDCWRGTATELRDTIGDGPGTIAKLNSAVTEFAPYLATHGISAKFPATRTKKGKIIVLRKEQT